MDTHLQQSQVFVATISQDDKAEYQYREEYKQEGTCEITSSSRDNLDLIFHFPPTDKLCALSQLPR